MKRMIASARRVTGLAWHRGLPPTNERARLTIEEGQEGPLLLRHDKDGYFCGDTWHESVEMAIAQAQVEFEVAAEDWSPCP